MADPPQEMPQRGVAELELPPIELPRGVDVRGTVVGEDGKPVAGAEVEAIWTGAGGGRPRSALARTDRTGAFTLHGVDPLAELSLTAWDGFASTPDGDGPGRGRRQRPIALTISPRNTDAHRRPGRRPRRPADRRRLGPDLAPGPGQGRARRSSSTRSPPGMARSCCAPTPTGATARDGDSRPTPPTTPRRPPRAGSSARSPAIAAGRESDKPAVLVLRRRADRRGPGRRPPGPARRRRRRPPVGRRADADRDPHRGRRPVPAPRRPRRAGAGLRGEGRLPALACSRSTTGSRPVEVVLARTDEPPAVAYHTLPPALPVEEEKALARRLIAAARREGPGRAATIGEIPSSWRRGRDRPARRDRVAGRGQVCRGRLRGYVRQILAEPWPARASTKRRPSSRPADATCGPGYIGLVDVAPT